VDHSATKSELIRQFPSVFLDGNNEPTKRLGFLHRFAQGKVVTPGKDAQEMWLQKLDSNKTRRYWMLPVLLGHHTLEAIEQLFLINKDPNGNETYVLLENCHLLYP